MLYKEVETLLNKVYLQLLDDVKNDEKKVILDLLKNLDINDLQEYLKWELITTSL